MTNHYHPKLGGLGNNGFLINGRIITKVEEND